MSTYYTLSDGKEYRVVDGDTLADKNENRYRLSGIDTYEIEHEAFKGTGREGLGTNQGLVQKEILESLIRDKKFTDIDFTGDSDKSTETSSTRKIINLFDNNNSSAAGMMYYHGLVAPRGGFFNEQDRQLWKQGLLARNTGKQSDDYYRNFRDKLKLSSQDDYRFLKTKAFDEAHFNPNFNSGVQIRNLDRTIDNQATNVFSSSFRSGLDGMQGGLFGVMEMLGSRTGIESLEDYGTTGARWNEFQQQQMPEWVDKIENVNSISDFSQWAVGALGGSLPYFGLMAAGFLPIPGIMPVSFGSMSMVYAGQTWNEMDGLPDENSAVIATASGIAQALFERLGGKIVFGKNFKPNDFSTDEGIKKAVIALTKTQRDETGRFTKKKLTKEEAANLLNRAKSREIATVLKDFSNNSAIWKAYGAMVAKSAGKGFAGEATTETMQEATQNISAWLGTPEAKRKFDPEEFKSAMINSFAAGGLLGGSIQGGGAALTTTNPLSTEVRDYRWGQQKNDRYDTTDPVPIQATLANSRNKNAPFETPYNKKEFNARAKQLMAEKNISIKEANKIVDKENKARISGAEKIDRIVADMINTHEKNIKEQSTSSKVGEGVTKLKFLSTPMQVLSSQMGDDYFKSQTLIALGDYFGSPTGKRASGKTHVQRQRTLRGEGHAKLDTALDELTDNLGLKGHGKSSRMKAYKLLKEYVELNSFGLKEDGSIKRGEPKFPEGVEKNQEAFRQGIKKILEYEKYHQNNLAGIDKHYVNNLFSTFLNKAIAPSKVIKQKEKFINALMKDYSELTREQAEQEYEDIVNAPENYDAREYVNTNLTTKKPSHLKRKRDYSSDLYKDFHDENNYDSALVRNSEIANYVSDMEAVGWGGKGLNSMILTIQQELNEYYEKADGLSNKEAKQKTNSQMPYIAAEMYRHYQLHRGDYKRFKDKNVQHVTANLGAVMSLAYMGLAVFASLPEGGLVFRDATGKVIVDGKEQRVFTRALKNLSKITGQSMIAQMKKVVKEENLGKISDSSFRDKLLKEQTRRGMTDVETGSGHVIDAEVNVDRKTWLQREVMPRFYRYTGLTSFTTAMRMIRDSFALDWMSIQLDNVLRAVEQEATDPNYLMNNYEARSFNKLKEAGVDPRDMAARYNRLVNAYNRDRLTNNTNASDFFSYLDEVLASDVHPEIGEARAFSEHVDTARSNFVDAALVNPDASKRPAFYSDGRLRLLTIFQGYLSVFSAKIARPLLRDLAGKGSPADQMNAVAVTATMMALAFLGLAFRDEIKYGDKPVWLSDAEYIQRGVMASGILGQTERLFQLFFPLYSSEEDTLADRAWAEIGPLTGTIDSAMKGTKWALEDEREKAFNQFLKIAPGGVFTNTRAWTAEQLAKLTGE